MPRSTTSSADFSARLSFWLLSAFLVILWIAGGASRADVSGQAVVRFFAWIFLIVFVLFSARFDWRRVKPIAIFLGLAILLVFLQLVPLPPEVWTALPGRELLKGAAEVSDQPQPWRPLSISPSATANALGSLVVPALVLVLCAQLTRDQHRRIASILLGLIFAGSLLALLQFSGANFDNPLINYQDAAVSGNFANRNHFALFVAIGCLLAPLWGFRGVGATRWTAIIAFTLLPFFLLVALATGSRAGVLLTALAIVAGLFFNRDEVKRQLQALPRWAAGATVGLAIVLLVGAAALSFSLGRAVSIDRVFVSNAGEDLRAQALPSVIETLMRYFPAGSGFGAFDPAYRIGEVDALLQPRYFNHAHNDWLEVVLDGGVLSAVLLAAIIIWVGISAVRIWRRKVQNAGLALPGAFAVVLIMLASVPDYPARTPMIMALLVIAAAWLHLGSGSSSDAYPADRPRP
ncbi:hypothetical protein A3736_09690 [Erythrobacter sp. HI0063]|jgi:O-antigen ligase|uniref:O-antigen ligase family protein n=1 Tax=Erythrobacter sp. HI0063 TaxID=1822240 RepID=UPI0007C3CC54|nr:O-antigen ligase family protein [Erythrobacter sp. HI0063]KZY55742.1 hypothetical protein A3736_09690 [Erythrobacter sp. HI0063]